MYLKDVQWTLNDKGYVIDLIPDCYKMIICNPILENSR